MCIILIYIIDFTIYANHFNIFKSFTLFFLIISLRISKNVMQQITKFYFKNSGSNCSIINSQYVTMILNYILLRYNEKTSVSHVFDTQMYLLSGDCWWFIMLGWDCQSGWINSMNSERDIKSSTRSGVKREIVFSVGR